jgi:hypothetical protein
LSRASPKQYDIFVQKTRDAAQTEELLTEQLESARAEYNAASARFEKLTQISDGAIPHPDGSLLVKQAGANFRHSLRCYMVAIKRLSAFVLHGVVPDDLEKPR